MSELNLRQSKPTVLYEDNQSAISYARNAQVQGRMKHIDICYHLIQEKVIDGAIELKYCSFDQMLADMLTKGLSGTVLNRLREILCSQIWRMHMRCRSIAGQDKYCGFPRACTFLLRMRKVSGFLKWPSRVRKTEPQLIQRIYAGTWSGRVRLSPFRLQQ